MYAPFDDGRTAPLQFCGRSRGAQVARLNPENPKKPVKEPLKRKDSQTPKAVLPVITAFNYRSFEVTQQDLSR
jgi:hypothetical protein